ncbi:MAG TPA: carboxypeptidase-like regulatory domain-containing protein, partial [Longimicrobiales bacterium]|nr:carboxypeptidase-like regulatory domain-containing protein [Longimicrobiales bacterium]
MGALMGLGLLTLGACGAGDSGTAGGSDDIFGVVTGPSGPEAGVWVIAETQDLPTPFARIVVTDDDGRYLVPDLPNARYSVWVRGYGLVDSEKVEAGPGSSLDLTAVPAPDQVAAAHYYPSGSWLSLIEVPPHEDVPGTGPSGNGISPDVRTQADWLRRMKSG